MSTEITEIVKKAADRIEAVENRQIELAKSVADINGAIIEIAQKSEGMKLYGTAPRNVVKSALSGDALAPLAKGQSKQARIPITASIDQLRKSFIHGDQAGSSSDSDLVTPMTQRVAGIAGWTGRPLSILDVIRRLPCNSNTFEFNRINSYTSAAAYQVLEGGAKAQGSVPVELERVSIRTIAHYFKASNQVISDEPSLMGFMETLLRYGVMEKLERELIGGTGTDSIAGLLAPGNFTVFTPTTDATNAADKIGQAIAYLRIVGWEANLILLHPNDWQAMRAERASTSNEYLVGSWSSPAAPNVWGVPVVASPAVTEGDCLVLDANQVAILDRQNPVVEIGYVDDDFTRNLMTMRGELRAALAVFAPSAVLYFEI